MGLNIFVLVRNPPYPVPAFLLPAGAGGHWGRLPSPPYFFGIAAASAAVRPKKEKVVCGALLYSLFVPKKQKRHWRNSLLWRDVLFQFFIKLRQSVVVVTNHNLELLANLGRL